MCVCVFGLAYLDWFQPQQQPVRAPVLHPLSSPQHPDLISQPCDSGLEPRGLETDVREGRERAETDTERLARLLIFLNFIFNPMFQIWWLEICIKPLFCTIYEASSKAPLISKGGDKGSRQWTKTPLFALVLFKPGWTFPSQMITDCWSSALYQKEAISHTEACLFPTDDSKCAEQIAVLCLNVFNMRHAKLIIRAFWHISPQAPHSSPVFILFTPKMCIVCCKDRKKEESNKRAFCVIFRRQL